jgi:hypothetical protein
MANNYYKPKVWNAYCDSCGFKFKSDQLKKRWDGLMVDDACWEPRHPQDFLRAVKETSNKLPWTRPNDGSSVADESGLYVTNGYWINTDPNNVGINTFYEYNYGEPNPPLYYVVPDYWDDGYTEVVL